MTKKTGYLLGMLVTIVFCMILAWFFCCGAGINAASTDDQVITTTESNTGNENAGAAATAGSTMPFKLALSDGTEIYNTASNFNFKTSEQDILLPLNEEVQTGIKTLKEYLADQGNEDKTLDITGLYDQGEVNNSAFSNLGLARANAVKNYLVNEGIPSKRINTYGERNTSLSPSEGIYKGPLTYRLYAQAQADQDSSMTEMKRIADAIKAEPLVLYFDNAAASVSLNEQQRLKLGDISRYLDKVDDASITVIGHTDGNGSNTTNDRLGLERADFAKEYLKNNGIPGLKIKTISRGKREPIASNATAEGRAKNRRAVVTIN